MSLNISLTVRNQFDQLETIPFRELLAARNERGILKKVRTIVLGAARRLTRQSASTKPLQKVNGLSASETTFTLCFTADAVGTP